MPDFSQLPTVRAALRLSQTALASQADVRQQTVAMVERGKGGDVARKAIVAAVRRASRRKFKSRNAQAFVARWLRGE